MAAQPRRILHLIERLTLGGASRTLVAAAAHSARTTGTRHRLLSLRPPLATPTRRAREAGIDFALPADLASEVAKADIVHVHFWNTPELYAALRTPLPPARLALTCHIGGMTAPHILTDEVAALADLIIATSPHTLAALAEDVHAKTVLAPSPADFTRLGGIVPVPHEGFAIGYIGTVDFAKMHPRFAAMHAALAIDDVRIIVCGDGAARRPLAAEVQALGAAHRFELRGYVEDIAPVLAGLDVFGYPLCEDSYATTELVLQEAMYAGLPCVVFANGGGAYTVHDGETGFVVRTEADYVDRIAYLHRRPEERMRMGAAAAAYARARFGVDNLAPLVDAAYDRLMTLPKRHREAPLPRSGAEAMMAGLDAAAGPFRASLSAEREVAEPAAARIANASPALASADAGGVLHYRRAFPDDAALRFWSGLVLLGQGRPAMAAAEFKGAAALGFDSGRASFHLARAARAAGNSPLAEEAAELAARSGYQ